MAEVQVDLSPRPLRGTDLTVGRLALGTMTFGTQLDEAASEQAVLEARERGVTLFDCADSYGGGRSEEILGRIVRPFRDHVQIASKVGSRRTATNPKSPRLSRKAIAEACENSLRRLGVDYVDLYYLHMPDELTPFEESLEAISTLVDQGKVRYPAMSNYPAWRIADAVHLAERHGWSQPRAFQPVYNLLARRLEDEYASCTQHFGLPNLVYNPLAGGLLTGKHEFDDGPQEGTRFTWRSNYLERYWRPELFEAVRRLSAIANSAGMSLIELAVRWLLTRPVVDVVVLGVSNLEHLDTNLRAARGPAPDEDTVNAIDDVWEHLRGAAPMYNR